VTVTSLFEGSPAYRAGIRRGDIIAKVGEEDAKGWATEEVVKRVKGPKGTTVDLTIRRPGLETLIPLTVERDEIKIATVRTAFMLAPGTGYIRLQDFSETSNAELGEALARLKAANMDRLVLDLRDNPGGPLDQAIAVANRFLKRGQMIVSTRGRIPNSDEDYRATQQGGYTDIPLIVLVNRGSASASEIVTGSMQDHDRGLVVGETTFGKALVQSVYRISGGAGLALTTAHYYTPSGRLIQRPWDETFDEYLSYTTKDQEAPKAHNPSDLKRTDGGRPVYSGGGIEPDKYIAGQIEGFSPTQFGRLLYSRGEFENYAQQFTAEGDTRIAPAPNGRTLARNFVVTEQMIDEFKKQLADARYKMDDASFAKDHDFIRAMIRFRIDEAVFGIADARRHLVTVDPQVQGALQTFGEAERLPGLGKSTARAQ
jgi:carboxyl-terminal processing protease